MSFGAGWRGWFASLTLVFAVFVPVFMAISAFLTKYNLVDFKFGFVFLTLKVGLILSVAAFALSALALVLSLIKAPRKKAFIVAAAGFLIASSVVGRAVFTFISAGIFPPIHDIQTNWEDPVHPSEFLLGERLTVKDVNPILDDASVGPAAASRWPEYVGQSVADIQEQNEHPEAEFRKPGGPKPYPPLDTFYIEKDASGVFDDIILIIQENGWELVTTNPELGRIEATVTSSWFGFKDDVMIRIRAESDSRSQIDIRSVSRVGVSDLGANAKRVYELSQQIKRKSGDAYFN